MRLIIRYSISVGLALLFFLGYTCKDYYAEAPPFQDEFPMDSTIVILQSLPSKVKESSGIISYRDKIWTHNDSGDRPRLYELTADGGEITRQILIEGDNEDWEDITQDEAFIYVGDFGNNEGKRQDLAIYKIAKVNLLEEKDEIEAIKLDFEYPDRLDFNPPAYKHNFDCEAITSFDDSLFIFSKNYLDKQCRVYSLSKDESQQTARLLDKFDTKGLITGAAIDKERGVLALLGYNLDPTLTQFGPFVWLFWDFPNHDFFKGKSKRVNLPLIAQAEGIAYWKEDKFLISTEKMRMTKGKLMVMETAQWMD